ncbi:MAG TPA: polysaccharide biosynthesis tyrosine autokinase [Terracidiphilus sp.]|nr:polysaccharide biosynthesis tyrosine autokinase [Terracidiphilus sp.]
MKQTYAPERESVLTNLELGPQQAGPMLETSGEGDSLGRFVQFLKKRGWLILVAMLVGLGGAIAVNLLMHKQYTAYAQIEIVPDMSEEFRLEQIQDLASGNDDAEKLDTETQILRSRSLALQTITSLHLEANPDFLPLPKGRPWDLTSPSVREILIEAFLDHLAIGRSGHTSILEISVRSRKPALASLIANTLIDNYIERSFHDNYAATEKISGWLNAQLNGLKESLGKSQQQMIAYQRDLGIVGMDPKDSVVVTSLEELNKQLADAEVDRMVKEARLRAIKSSSPDVIDAAASTDVSLQASRQTLAQLKTEYTSLIQTYGPGYPRVKALKAQIEQLEQTVATAERAEVDRAQKEFDAAQNNESMLRKNLNDEEQHAYNNGEKSADFEFARQNYEANRLLYDGLQERLQEAGIMAGLHSSSIHVVDNADVPTFPSRPRTTANLALGIGGGLFLGFGIALLLEGLDTNLKTMTDIERALQLPLLAAIPSVETEELLPSKFRELAVARGSSSWSRIAEALRGMRTSVLLSSPGAPPQVIMVTSTRPAEGKSSVATLMAITFALNGSRVLLIDADLRRPSVHLRFRLPKGLGLSSVLSGKSSPSKAIVEWPDLPNLNIMTSGPVPPLPSELLGSKQMEELIADMRTEYEFILIDTPPVLAVTDASILSRLTDAALLIIRYGTAQRHVVQRCADLLERSGAHLLGVAVNAVDFKAPEYSEYYGRKYYEYYGERNPE